MLKIKNTVTEIKNALNDLLRRINKIEESVNVKIVQQKSLKPHVCVQKHTYTDTRSEK